VIAPLLRRGKRIVYSGIGLLVLVSAGHTSHASEPQTLMGQFEDEAQIIPGEHVLRMDLDVTGDGRPELLLAKENPHGQGWLVYSWVEGGRQVKYVGTAYFSFLLFKLQNKPAPPRIVASVPGEGGENRIVAYQIDQSVTEVALDADKPLAFGDFASWRKSAGLKVWSVDWVDLATKAAPTWEVILGETPRRGGLREVTLTP
jgi:hypothetical protein